MALKEKLTREGEIVMHEIEDETTGQKMNVSLSAAQLESLLLKVVTAARQPDEETQQRKAEEKKRREDLLISMMKEGEQEEASKLASWNRCDHRKPDNSSRVHGQIHHDGLIHPICLWCQKLFTPYPPPRELMNASSGF